MGGSAFNIPARCSTEAVALRGNILIPAPHGRLEAIYRPKSAAAERVALVLHPHPQYQGTMHNKVVFRAARTLERAGFETLRFNFRGVGRSSGSYGGGGGEAEDTRIALDFLLEQHPRAADVLIAGFSFGAAVGLKVGCGDPRVQRLIAIGTPALRADLSFLTGCAKPILFIHGERDPIAPLEPVERLVAELSPASATLVRIPEADHFFAQRLDQLEQAIRDFAGPPQT